MQDATTASGRSRRPNDPNADGVRNAPGLESGRQDGEDATIGTICRREFWPESGESVRRWGSHRNPCHGEAVYDGMFSTPKTAAGVRQIPLSEAH
jgi:hypothetical protein